MARLVQESRRPELLKAFASKLVNVMKGNTLPSQYISELISSTAPDSFNPQFDSLNRPPSEALGARLIYAFYEESVLKEVVHDAALDLIVMRIQGNNPDLIVPIVVHIDEHGVFISDMNKAFKTHDGKDYFLGMLKMLGSAATSSEGRLSGHHKKGAYFLVPITTGTSHSAANINEESHYNIKPVPLPLLTYEESKTLAASCLQVTRPNNEPHEIDSMINDPLFQIALGDTGGLPGLIYFLSTSKQEGISYVQHLHYRTREYVSANWDGRWAAVTSVCLARPLVDNTTVLMTEYQHANSGGIIYATRHELYKDHPEADDTDIIVAARYTVQDALDGGTVFWRTDGMEIGLALALLAKFNGGRGMFNPILTKEIPQAQEWTWQNFEKAHLLYLAATMAALIKEKDRFDNITLGTLLRNVRPSDSSVLSESLELPTSFHGATFDKDLTQCIPKSSAKRGSQITVTQDDFEHVRLAMDGTPIVDGYQNLRLRAASSGIAVRKTMFIQYKHSGLMSRTSAVNISTMNKEVRKLAARLQKYGWPDDRGWIFLWITNRDVGKDAKPDPHLLWVDKNTMAYHAPLLGTRGLVPWEDLRQNDED